MFNIFLFDVFLAEIFRNEKHLHVRMNDDGYTVPIVAEMTSPIVYVVIAILIEFRFKADDVRHRQLPYLLKPMQK